MSGWHMDPDALLRGGLEGRVPWAAIDGRIHFGHEGQLHDDLLEEIGAEDGYDALGVVWAADGRVEVYRGDESWADAARDEWDDMEARGREERELSPLPPGVTELLRGDPWAERTAMAESTGDPELDAILTGFLEEEIKPQAAEEGVEWREWISQPGICGDMASWFHDWLWRQTGKNQDWRATPVPGAVRYTGTFYDPDLDCAALPHPWTGFPMNTPDEHGYADRPVPGADDHEATLLQSADGRVYLVDWAAGQYGYTEFPMVQRLDGGGGWERQWAAKTADADHWWEPAATNLNEGVEVPGEAPGMAPMFDSGIDPEIEPCPHCGRPNIPIYVTVCPDCGMRIRPGFEIAAGWSEWGAPAAAEDWSDDTRGNWAYLDGKVAFGGEPWALVEGLARSLGAPEDEATALGNSAARGLLPGDRDIALGTTIRRRGKDYPQVWITTLDRNAVWDAVTRAMGLRRAAASRGDRTQYKFVVNRDTDEWTWRDISDGSSYTTHGQILNELHGFDPYGPDDRDESQRWTWDDWIAGYAVVWPDDTYEVRIYGPAPTGEIPRLEAEAARQLEEMHPGVKPKESPSWAFMASWDLDPALVNPHEGHRVPWYVTEDGQVWIGEPGSNHPDGATFRSAVGEADVGSNPPRVQFYNLDPYSAEARQLAETIRGMLAGRHQSGHRLAPLARGEPGDTPASNPQAGPGGGQRWPEPSVTRMTGYGTDEGTEGFWGERRAWIYVPEDGELFLGVPGSHHHDIAAEFALPDSVDDYLDGDYLDTTVVYGAVYPSVGGEGLVAEVFTVYDSSIMDEEGNTVGPEPPAAQFLVPAAAAIGRALGEEVKAPQAQQQAGWSLLSSWDDWWDLGNPTLTEGGTYDSEGLIGSSHRRPWIVTNDGTVMVGDVGTHHTEEFFYGDYDLFRAQVRSLGMVDNDGRVWMYDVAQALPQDKALVEEYLAQGNGSWWDERDEDQRAEDLARWSQGVA
jgi:hypothetical protein